MRAIARAQPNIALIKYWGKRDTDRNLPAVGSISITLAELYTTMCVEYDDALLEDALIVNGHADSGMLPRIQQCLDTVLGENRRPVHVTSQCNFPIAAGLASSASAFAALTVAAGALAEQERSDDELASLAGRASGSAARSLYGGFVELENCGQEISVSSLRTATEWPLQVVVAITATGPKSTGSTEAMEVSRKTSPFFERWVEQQPQDLTAAREAIAAQDFAALATVAEHNCLKMHSVMWGSRPPMIYWNSVTLACMQTIRDLQDDGIPVFFTIDAGPQVKAVCTPEVASQVHKALAKTTGVEAVMLSSLGEGAALESTA